MLPAYLTIAGTQFKQALGLISETDVTTARNRNLCWEQLQTTDYNTNLFSFLWSRSQCGHFGLILIRDRMCSVKVFFLEETVHILNLSVGRV